MAMTKIERQVLVNQLVLLRAMAQTGETQRAARDTVAMLRKPKRVARTRTRKATGAFSGDVGDQGYKGLAMPIRPYSGL